MIEPKLIKEYPHTLFATDEVGRGPIGGPVVIGAIQLDISEEKELRSLLRKLKKVGIQDSKAIGPETRKSILESLGIKELTFKTKNEIVIGGIKISYITWDMDHEVIDQENILAASLRGMKESCLFLSETKKYDQTVLIDGHMKFRWGTETPPWTEIPIVQGDSKSLLIGLASIIAKEKRDTFMKEMHALYPEYGFDSNFGYPTKFHREAIQKFGPSPIHRKTFKGVKEFITA